VVDAEGDRGDGVEQPAHRAGGDAGDDAGPRAGLEADEGAEPRAEDEHPLEPDVDDAGALGPQAAEGGEPDRDGEAQRGPGGAAAGELVGAAEHADERQQDEQAEGDGEAALPARERDPAAPALRRGVDQAGGRGRRAGRGAHAALRSVARRTARSACVAAIRRTAS
jgi:hypothetical protein